MLCINHARLLELNTSRIVMANDYDLYRIPAQDMKKVATGLILHYEEAQEENPMTDFLRLTRNILIAILLSWLGFSISPSETPESPEQPQSQIGILP